MSNPKTYYSVGGVDLSDIFQPISLGSGFATQTGYKVGNNDLNTIFAAYTTGTKAITTGYSLQGYGDLNNVFAKLNIPNTLTMNVVSPNNTNYTSGVNGTITWYKFVLSGTTTGTATISFSASGGTPNSSFKINFCLIGGGDAGGGNNIDATTFYMGGGGGGIYYSTNIDIVTNNSMSIQIGQPGLTRSSQVNSSFRLQSPTNSSLGSYTATAASGLNGGSGNYNGGNGGNNGGAINVTQNGASSGFPTFAGPDGVSYKLGGGGGSSYVTGLLQAGGNAGNGTGGTGGGQGFGTPSGQDASANANNFGGGGGGAIFSILQNPPLPGDGGKGAVFIWWTTQQ